MKDELLATPEMDTYLADIHRLTEQAERLPSHVAAERQAIVAAVDDRMKAVDATAVNIKSALAQADGFAASVDTAAASLDAMLRTADGVLRRFDGTSENSQAHPFDVREYAEGVKELAAALQNTNDVLKSSDALLSSPEWGRRIDEVNRSADARMRVVADQSQVVVSAGFRQLWITIAAVFALLVLYRLFGFYLTRRPRGVAPPAAASAGPPDRPPASNYSERVARPRTALDR